MIIIIDRRALDVLTRMAVALESIAKTLKSGDDDELAVLTQHVKEKTDALAGALPPTT